MQRFTVLAGPGALPAFVAGAGFEPAHRLIMSQVPYLSWPSRSSPNGIRTRALALKGRHPWPLDDGAEIPPAWLAAVASVAATGGGLPGLRRPGSAPGSRPD